MCLIGRNDGHNILTTTFEIGRGHIDRNLQHLIQQELTRIRMMSVSDNRLHQHALHCRLIYIFGFLQRAILTAYLFCDCSVSLAEDTEMYNILDEIRLEGVQPTGVTSSVGMETNVVRQPVGNGHHHGLQQRAEDAWMRSATGAEHNGHLLHPERPTQHDYLTITG